MQQSETTPATILRSRPRYASAARCVVLVTALVAALAGCSSSKAASNAPATLKKLRGTDVLTQPPTQGALVGNAEDSGSTDPVNGRNPGITSVFATTLFPRAVEAYYQSVYREYQFSEDCCATADHIELVGAAATETIGITITTGAAHIPDHYRITVKQGPAGATTWATVQVTATR